ncbi:MAG: hypothetical protein ACLUFN_05495 [Eubacterium sp.]
MKDSLKFQLNLLFKSKMFNICLIVYTVLALIPTVYCAAEYFGSDALEVPPAYSIFAGGTDLGMITSVYYFLLPLLVSLPFADSCYTDRKNNTIYPVLTKAGINNYYYSKMITVFISGVLVILIPLLIQFFINFAVFPFHSTKEGVYGFGENQTNYYWNLYEDNNFIMFKDLFYSGRHSLYVFMFLLIQALTGGLLAVITYQLSFFFNSVRIVMLSITFIANYLVDLIPVPYYDFSLSSYIIPFNYFASIRVWTLLVLVLCYALAIILPIPYAKRRLGELI